MTFQITLEFTEITHNTYAKTHQLVMECHLCNSENNDVPSLQVVMGIR